jgi:hypothetical protein
MQPELEFFLGGRDLEMVAIRQVIESVGGLRLHDDQLTWGARASHYQTAIAAAQAAGRVPVVIELEDDLGLENEAATGAVIIIDHHGLRAGRNVPTSLEQVFVLLNLPQDQWTRFFALVAANDRGHVRAMQAIGATREEIERVRIADRAAQGATAEEEASGRIAAMAAESRFDGRLTVVKLPHCRTATVTDALERGLGGTGFQNLVIHAPDHTFFFGTGRIVSHLGSRFPRSRWGGELPDHGFWRCDYNIDHDEFNREVEVATTTKPAGKIAVKAFHHTLIWPLLMRSGRDSGIDKFIKAFEEAGWVEDSKGSTTVHSDYQYSEITYFHPVVRDFLFGNGEPNPENRTLRRFQRFDLSEVEITIDSAERSTTESFTVQLRVERVELLIIRPKIAMLVVEVSNRSATAPTKQEPKVDDQRVPLMLDQVLYLQSRLRHAYPPYFIGTTHGECPLEIVWKGRPQPKEFQSVSPESEFDQFVRVGAEPPMYSHWRQFLGKSIEPYQSVANRAGPGLFLQQLYDDRIPAMSLIAVNDPNEIHPDDEDRLPGFDPPGLDYEPAFRESLRASYRYTRYRHAGTTFYCDGTSFSMVTKSNSVDFRDLLLTHFRRHYKHLAVIAQYQQAALLEFADELGDIAKDLGVTVNEKSDRALRDRIRKIQRRFLKFRTRSYFTEVSNGIEGKDLFRLWFDHLSTKELFERVSQISSDVSKTLENHEIKDLAKVQKNLTLVATIGLSISTVIGWAALFPEQVRERFQLVGSVIILGPWMWLLIAVAIASVSCYVVASQFGSSSKSTDPDH